MEQILSSEEQQKWMTKILGYDFEIIYKKDNLTMEQNHMKQQADQHRSERSFEVGDEWKNDKKVWTIIQRLQ